MTPLRFEFAQPPGSWPATRAWSARPAHWSCGSTPPGAASAASACSRAAVLTSPDPDHHRQGRQGSDYPARSAHRAGDRPGHRRTVRRPRLGA